MKTGPGQHRIDIMNDCQKKALKEGCCEREWAWMDVSSTEKIDTKENLARVMAKSKSEIQTVTNGHLGQRCQVPVSNLTKEQVGRDQQGKDVMNDHQGKALKEGCCEREWAWMSVSSREKNNTKKNLVRVTTKSKSRMQEVSNRCVGQMGNELRC